MTWLDLASLGGFAVLLSLAYKRGVILELTDLACLLLGGLLSFRLFRPFASAMHNSIFSGWSMGFLEKFCLYVIFIVSCLVIFGAGLTLRRRSKEEHYLEKEMDQRLGLAVGLFKGLIVIVMGLGLLFYNDAFPPREVRKLKKGGVVSTLIGFQSAVKPIVYIVAPSDLAKKFLKKGLGPPTISKKSK